MVDRPVTLFLAHVILDLCSSCCFKQARTVRNRYKYLESCACFTEPGRFENTYRWRSLCWCLISKADSECSGKSIFLHEFYLVGFDCDAIGIAAIT